MSTALACFCLLTISECGPIHWSVPHDVHLADDPPLKGDPDRTAAAAAFVAVHKNFYGSGALWSGRLGAKLFSLFQTAQLWGIDVGKWLTD